ncbi:hypothetical protein BJV74DRAFT_74892 [Russula compacta]|nr:hypothetical protein BJV74DRAFT_74892 [Russula compacta]
MAIERAQALERENAAARAELAALRAHPDSTPHPAELQLPELTLALRRASDKLTLAEDALRARTAQFVDMQGATSRAHYAAESAFGVAAAARAREDDALERERGLALRLRTVEEEGRLMDRVVREYADLVRTLERRQSLPVSSSSSSLSSSPPPPTPPPKHSPAPAPASRTHASNGRSLGQQDRSGTSIFGALQEQRAGLNRLAEEFEGVNEALRDEIGRLQVDVEGSRAELDAERKAAEEERLRLSNALAELERLKHDDNAAAKMVSRYMKFSQNTTNTLQKALESLTARHAATTSTLHTQLASARATLAIEQRQSARLRDVLDEATEQLARETYGRRREIALRLAVVGREDQLAEALRRWVRRAQETRAKENVLPAQRLDTIVRDAGELLALVDGAAAASSSDSRGEEDDAVLVGPGIGSVARIVAARDAVRRLEEELQVETERRVRLERMLGRAEVDEDGRVVPPKPRTPSSAVSKSPSVPTEAIPEVGKVMVDVATSPICPSPSQASVQEDSASSLEPSLADLPAVSSQTDSTAVEHISTTLSIVHQPTPRSTIGSPTFLSPRSSPPSSPVSILANTHSTLPASSLCLQDNTLTSTSNEPQADTTRSPSPPAGPSQQFSFLLAELGKTKTRYDELQRVFRDCHLALRELSQTLQALPPSSSSLPTSALQMILARLDDFNEDARVELEIRIADEERIARGYATLLAVPGAIASAEEAQEVERAVRGFVEGSGDDETIARARNRFARKREDLEHDVAALKRAVHELPQQTEAPSSPLSLSLPSPSPSPLRPATPAAAANSSSSWTSLAAGLFASGSGSSRPASPSPTFGAVVTSPRVRRTVSSSSTAEAAGPLVALQQQLRIPMPELHHHHQVQGAPWPSPVRPGSKARTTSGMYMLGLGMRGGAGVPGESRKVSIVGTAMQEAAAGDCEVE